MAAPFAPATPGGPGGALHSLRSLLRSHRPQQAIHTRANRATLYAHGGDFFPALFAAMEAAATAIRAEFYIVRADATGDRFARALMDAAGRGVDVALIYDTVGCFDTPASYFRRLEAAGVRCLAFNPPTFRRLHWLDVRNHRKVAVIDGRTAFLGGINVGDEYAGFGESLTRWRDVGARLDGPAAAELDAIFRKTWTRETGDELAPCAALPADDGDAEVTLINGTPRQTRSAILRSFSLTMTDARHSIRIVTPYFVPGPRILRALLRAVQNGVQVQLMLPSVSDLPLVQVASRAWLRPLLQAGVEVYQRQGTILHAKVMLIDEAWATIGSANLDQRSFHRNYELNAVIDSHVFGAQVQRMFTDDLDRSRQLVLDEYERAGWLVRLLAWLLTPLGRFL
ncbi:MAG: phospholipase D-like domain-containing protein [Desulfobulbus sp.]|nr:phospholipase D-like domain-containing protein [Desulfobulbus sp.]